jgi:Glycosyl hydrolase catalytic core
MPIKKRCLLWDWTNTAHIPSTMDQIDFSGPLSSVANWNTWTPPELRSRAPFRPTVRSAAQLSGDDWANVLASTQPITHFFNEPERAGISASSAAAAWAAQMVPLRAARGTKLVGPSCASDAAGEQWLAEFMARVGAAPPDFLGLHYYGADGDAAVRYIEGMHARYPELPVIVSEIACISRKKEEVYAFTARVANWMDETEWVFEYAFFGCMREVADGFVSPEAQLMDKEGGFTELMGKLMMEQPITV